VGRIDSRLEQHLNEGLTVRPAKPMSLTVKVDLDLCNF